jgi:carbamoyltransferase
MGGAPSAARKHDVSFPHHAGVYCVEAEGVKLSEINHVMFYDKPFLNSSARSKPLSRWRRAASALPDGNPLWLNEKLSQKSAC